MEDALGPDLEQLIRSYVYWAILGGTFPEGEMIVVLAGFAAHRGYLHLPRVIGAVFAGTLAGDQLFFYRRRRHSARFLSQRPAWVPKVERATRIIDRYETPTLVGFRFLYGLRPVTPFALGASRVSTHRFVSLNLVGALVWAVTIGTRGYFFGQALETLLEDSKEVRTRRYGRHRSRRGGWLGPQLLEGVPPPG